MEFKPIGHIGTNWSVGISAKIRKIPVTFGGGTVFITPSNKNRFKVGIVNLGVSAMVTQNKLTDFIYKASGNSHKIQNNSRLHNNKYVAKLQRFIHKHGAGFEISPSFFPSPSPGILYSPRKDIQPQDFLCNIAMFTVTLNVVRLTRRPGLGKTRIPARLNRFVGNRTIAVDQVFIVFGVPLPSANPLSILNSLERIKNGPIAVGSFSYLKIDTTEPLVGATFEIGKSIPTDVKNLPKSPIKYLKTI